MTSRFLSLTKRAYAIIIIIKKKKSEGGGGVGGTTLSQFKPKVYDQLKRLKSRGKLDQGESSPNFHYFQVV